MCREDEMRLMVNQRASDDPETESGGESSDIRVGLREVGGRRNTGGYGITRRTYLILGEFKIGLDGFGNQRREGEPRQTVDWIT
jgi:hypothetical protein